MAIRIIRLEKDEILRKKSREVEVIDDKIQTYKDLTTIYNEFRTGKQFEIGFFRRRLSRKTQR